MNFSYSYFILLSRNKIILDIETGDLGFLRLCAPEVIQSATTQPVFNGTKNTANKRSANRIFLNDIELDIPEIHWNNTDIYTVKMEEKIIPRHVEDTIFFLTMSGGLFEVKEGDEKQT